MKGAGYRVDATQIVFLSVPQSREPVVPLDLDRRELDLIFRLLVDNLLIQVLIRNRTRQGHQPSLRHSWISCVRLSKIEQAWNQAWIR